MNLPIPVIRRIGEAVGRFALIISDAVREGWDEDRVMEEIQKADIISNKGLQAMREADKIRDDYVRP